MGSENQEIREAPVRKQKNQQKNQKNKNKNNNTNPIQKRRTKCYSSNNTKKSKSTTKSLIHNLDCFYTNADQLRNKMSELTVRVKNENPMIVGVTEVKPKRRTEDQIPPAEYSIDNYEMFHKNLDNSTGRGMVLYTHNALKAEEVNLKTQFEEFISVEVDLVNDDKLLIVQIYRSDSGTKENNEKLRHLINEACSLGYSHLLIMGDFNYPKILWQLHYAPGEKSEESKFIECIENNYLTQHIDKPTRWRGDNEPHILDLILTHEDNISDIEYQSPLGKSDHSIIKFKYHCYAILRESEQIRLCYDKADYDEMRNEAGKINWRNELQNDMNVEEMWDIFHRKIKHLEASFVPKKKFKTGKIKNHAFKLDESTRNLIKKKHALSRKVVANHMNQEVRREYNKIRNKVKSTIKKLKKNFERELVKKAKQNPKAIWKYIQSKSKTRAQLGKIHIDPENPKTATTDDDKEKAEIFSKYFKSVFVEEPPHDIPTIESRFVEHEMPPLFITKDMVSKVLNKLKVDKSPGLDQIHPKILKELAEKIADGLAIIFNKSLMTKQVPNIWKKARVTAIYKKKNKKLACNYRPVSLTSIVCKVMETLVRDHIVEYMKRENLFSDRQYGFISGRSTTLQLLAVLDLWTEAIEAGHSIDAIYMDFRKAFDTVPHRRLLGKLNSYHIRKGLIEWVECFLTGRQQIVTVNGESSGWQDVTSGIPQGSVLGPILFVIYINDLPLSLKSGEGFMFADDTKIFKIITRPEHQAEMQEDLYNMDDWSEAWLLGYNLDKCIKMHIGPNKKPYDYELQGELLEHVNEEKDIGVTVDDNLTFESHILEKVKKANQMCGMIRRNFEFLDTDIFPILYKTVVRPHLETAVAVWAPYKIELIKKMEGVQRRATKYLPGMKDLTYPERLRKLKLPTLMYRRLRGDLIEAFKILKPVYDSNVRPVLTRLKDVATYTGLKGYEKNLYLKHGQKNVRKYSFSLRVVDHWNSLPDDVLTCDTVNSFKNRIDKIYENRDIYYDFPYL